MARGHSRLATSGSAASSTSNRPSSAPSASRSAEATPETRFAPEPLCASRTRGARTASAIAAVVVFPFVAETSAEPCGSRSASRSTAPGSSFQRSFPGRVVPPPRPASRERRPAARATAASTESGTGGRTGRGYLPPTGRVTRTRELCGATPEGGRSEPGRDLGFARFYGTHAAGDCIGQSLKGESGTYAARSR